MHLTITVFKGGSSGRPPLPGLDLTKYLITPSQRRDSAMDSDITTGTESDFSDWDPAHAGLTSENSEDSDEYGIYYGDMYDTPIGSHGGYGGRTYASCVDRQTNQQMRKALTQLNSSQADSGYSGSGPLYPIHELGSGTNESSDNEEVHDDTNGRTSNMPVYGRYKKLEGGEHSDTSQTESCDSVETLMLHRLPGENMGMILGIEDRGPGSDQVSCVVVKSVTLGGAAYRASGGSKGLCVGDEILSVNSLELQAMSHDECVQVFRDMPLRVMLGVRRGQKDLPPVSISPAPASPISPARQPSRPKYRAPDPPRPRQVEPARPGNVSDSEDDGFGGFAVYQITVEKSPQENLGISIVPSYGSTKEFYQVWAVFYV